MSIKLEKDSSNNVLVRISMEDGSFFRKLIRPTQDYSNEPQEVKDFCDETFTEEVVSEYLKKSDLYKDTPLELLLSKKQKIEKEYRIGLVQLSGSISTSEMSSWSKQEEEARNLDKPTPLIDSIIVSRGFGETREEFAAKVIAKADYYSTEYGKLLGNYHNKVKAWELEMAEFKNQN